MQTTAVEQLRSRNTAVVFGTQINLSFYISKAMTIALVQQCHMSNKWAAKKRVSNAPQM